MRKSNQNMMVAFVFTSIFAGLAPVSCSNSVQTGNVTIAKWGPLKPPSRTGIANDANQQAPVKAFSDPEAFDYLWNTCASCHGPDGAYKSNWALPAKDKLSIAALEGLDGITRAYQAIVNKYDGNEGGSPSAMPLGVDFNSNTKAKQDSARAIKWFAERMVLIVKDAESLYPKDEKSGTSAITSSEVKVSLSYKCSSLRTGTSYLTKLTSALYNRNPNDAEMSLIAEKKDVPLSLDERLAIAGRIKSDTTSVDEFERVGLRSFAAKVADASKIQPAAIDAQANRTLIQNDLKDEFYQLLKKYYKDVPYRDILLMDKVMVTSRTAPLYEGCTAPPAPTGTNPPTWAECTLSPVRSNFFGTVAFLRAKPTSFLENNNNYGRAGAMFVVASGEALLPQTNGPVGTTVTGLPECLASSSKDSRGRVNTKAVAGVDEPLTGPFGSLTVPGFGNVCQGCHVRRGLAAGSKIFRGFGKFGEVITAATLDAACGTPTAANPCPGVAANPYRDDVVEAIKPDKANYDKGPQRFATDAPAQKARVAELDKTSPITVQFLKELLAESSDGLGTCIPVDSKTVKPVKNIKDMSEFVVGTQANVARGLARMIPKAIGKTQLTNQEVIMEVNKASSMSGGKLADIIVAYLATETFACQEE